MIFKPSPIGKKTLSSQALENDKKCCKVIGPCGFGAEAMYLNSFFISRRFYVTYGEVRRVFKRIAMSKGGFTGKGVFGTMAYLVVQYGDGREQQCNFKREADVDKALAWMEREHPEIPTHSAEAEKRLKDAAAAEEAHYLKELTLTAETTVAQLRAAKTYLEQSPALSAELSEAAKQKRIADQLKPSLRVGASVFAALCVAVAAYGLLAALRHEGHGMYLALFGGVFFLFTLSSGALPSRWNSKKTAQRDWEAAVASCRAYLEGQPGFPVPPQFAHPIVLERMIRVVREGRAQTAGEALQVMKEDLRALNASVTVTQKEHDEVVAVKPLFLVCDYQDKIG